MNVESFETREKKILEVAQKLLAIPEPLDETIIDCHFLFRFEPTWVSWVSQIRQAIWGFFGENQDSPFSMENREHWRLAGHLERYRGIGVGINADGLFIANKGKGYRPFNSRLQDLLDNFRNRDKEKDEEIQSEMWQEANQINKIHSEIRRLGFSYGLIPPEHEHDNYSPKQLSALYSRLFNWIFWKKTIPELRWPSTLLLESRIKGVKRTIRPQQASIGHWEPKEDGGRIWIPREIATTRSMTCSVRIRTWAIYFMTKRGGGQLTEGQAVDLWNGQYPVPVVTAKNYRSERIRLFESGSKKNAQYEAKYLRLDD